ncbi:MAG: hypothetical protein QOG49_1577, partial [Frankiaceae bacterium]|nr:hypothetical protein [Frankiaceae bacterium]
ADPVRAELRWLATSLSGARDTEVMSARLLADRETAADETVRAAAAAALERSLLAAQRRGAAALRAALDSDRYTSLLDTLVATAAAPPLTEAAAHRAGDALPPLARRAWRRLAKALDAIDGDAPDAQLHRARILAKQARYASEACSLAFGAPAARLAKEIVRVQDVLGEHQDAVVAATALQRLARTRAVLADSRLAFALGMLYCRQGQAAQHARAELPGVWRAVSRRGHRAWLE